MLAADHAVTRVYLPSIIGQTAITFEIFKSFSKAPLYVDEADCALVKHLTIECKDAATANKGVDVTMSFGSTEILAHAVTKCGKEASVSFGFEAK